MAMTASISDVKEHRNDSGSVGVLVIVCVVGFETSREREMQRDADGVGERWSGREVEWERGR